MFPSRHKVGAKGTLKPWHEIMPEAIRAAGYQTGAHISNGYISKPWGYQQGWDHFINNLRDGWRIDGAAMAGQGVDWATKNKDKPFFLYIGTIDPHVTYRNHEDIIGKYDTPALLWQVSEVLLWRGSGEESRAAASSPMTGTSCASRTSTRTRSPSMTRPLGPCERGLKSWVCGKTPWS